MRVACWVVVLTLAALLGPGASQASALALPSSGEGATALGASVSLTRDARSYPAAVLHWQPQVTRALRLWHRRYHLPFRVADVWQALRFMWRESWGNRWARNISSGAAGLFQWLPSWWREKGYPIFQAKWNIGMMAQYHASHEAVGRDPWAPWR